MKAIPTTYREYVFRSRLEAKWARFFDLLGWNWEYEPFDCDGWIPDFALIGKDQMTLVEVKPISVFDSETAAKIDRADTEHEVLLVGIGLFPTADWFHGDLGIGWLREGSFGYLPADGGWDWNEARLIRDGNRWGFHHVTGSYNDRMGNVYWKDSRYAPTDVSALWAQASNTTQWFPK